MGFRFGLSRVLGVPALGDRDGRGPWGCDSVIAYVDDAGARRGNTFEWIRSSKDDNM